MFERILFVVLLITLLYYAYHHSISNFTEIEIEGEVYRTHGSLDKNDEAARIMHTINENVIKLLKHIIKSGDGNKPHIQRLLTRYDWSKMIENSPRNLEKSTSYMQNKGEVFAMCLRDKNDKFIDINTLMFVAIHELSHLMTLNVDEHNKEFWMCFKYLLVKAKNIGIYTYVDYSKSPINYCGVDIKVNPLDLKFD